MRAIALYLARCGATPDAKTIFLASVHDVSHFSFIEKKAVREICTFLARTMLPRLEVGKREAINHENYMACAIRFPDSLGALIVTDKEYPSRVAFACLGKVCEDFRGKTDERLWKTVTADNSVAYKDTLRDFLSAYRDPSKFDSLSKTQAKVDETSEIMHKNIKAVLRNQEDLEVLLKNSEDVSDQSKELFKKSKKMKGCCTIQ